MGLIPPQSPPTPPRGRIERNGRFIPDPHRYTPAPKCIFCGTSILWSDKQEGFVCDCGVEKLVEEFKV